MEKIRVLVVDDSLVIRRALRECFRSDPEIEVVGVADNGLRAIEQIDLLKPDVVTLDIEMPEMDGLEALKVIRAKGSRIPIIMFSKYTADGATATLEALELGASDAVLKPEAQGGSEATFEVVKRQLATRIRALGRQARKAKRDLLAPSAPKQQIEEVSPFEVTTRVEAVGLAISTGGPSALIEIVQELSTEIAVPIFITQHMPPIFTKHLADRLSARGALKAHEATQGMIAEPGNVYIAPGNFHLETFREGDLVRINLSQAPHENSCRPSADVMFRSLASLYGAGVLGIVMTGMGHDGRAGCQHIKAQGGTVIAQDEASSLVWGMPKSVVHAGLHDAIVSLSGIAPLINKSCAKAEEKE